MKIGIVILNYNSGMLTIKYINKILKYKFFDNIIVVDNVSLENDTLELNEYCKDNDINYIQLDKNTGYAHGNNVGVKYALDVLLDEIVFISNPDVICPNKSLKRISLEFEKDQRIGVVTGIVHNFDSKHRPKVYSSFAYRVPTYKDMILNNFLVITKIRKELFHSSMYFEAEDVYKSKTLPVGCVSGCFFAINSKAYKDIDGFDESTFLYYEEAILGKKLMMKRYKTLVVDEPIFHDEDSSKNSSVKKLWRTFKYTKDSAHVYLRKYLNAKNSEILLYDFFSYIGFVERLIVNKIIELRKLSKKVLYD